MSKNVLYFLALFFSVLTFSAHAENVVVINTQDQASSGVVQEEHIDRMDVNATVNPDATVLVVETIEYDFGNQNKHGIFRTIPLGFTAKGESEHTNLQVNGVTNELNIPYKYSITSNDPVNIKIGDPDAVITGKHTYKITYVIKRSIGYFDNYDEFYWNLTGNAWEIPINSVTASIVLPKKVGANEIKMMDYCGAKGNTGKCGSFSMADNVVTYAVNAGDRIIPPSQVTIAVGFPKMLVAVPTKIDFFLSWFSRVWFIPFPLVIVFLWFRRKLAYLWKRSKFYRKNTIIAEYDAGDFTPLEVGLLVNKKLDNKDISALIVWLAIRGYIKIENEDKEFYFTRIKESVSDITESEKRVIEALDNIRGSNFGIMEANKFSSAISSASSRLIAREYISNKGVKNVATSSAFSASSVRIIVPLFLAVNPGIFIWMLLGAWAGFIFSVSLILIAFASPFFKNAFVLLTQKGLEAERKLQGLKHYIKVAEADRIVFANAPVKTPELFEKLLPFAMIFGLEKKWAKEFEGLYKTNPSWYGGSTTDVFSTVAFVGSVHFMQSSVQSAIASSVKSSSSSSWGGSSGGSSGSGSSGGGGGGGGGGSW
jgi:uncharacterized membrane protein YgcG